MATVVMNQVTKVYQNGFEAVHQLSLDVAEGEFMVLVGPSGCGKTTALRMVAGLEDITAGHPGIGGKVVNDIVPKERDIAMVFQNYALYPHMTVAREHRLRPQAAPSDRRPRSTSKVATRPTSSASPNGSTASPDSSPAASGSGSPWAGPSCASRRVFLMDEPLSNLDAKLRVQMRAEVSHIQRHLGVATMYVTHDQVEAMTMGDRVAVLRSGYLQQVDKPQVLYERPDNLFVAAFIGSPSMNLYRATVGEEVRSLQLGSQSVALPDTVVVAHPGLKRYIDREVAVGLRPEHLPIPLDGETGPIVEGDVDLVEALGSELLVHFRIDAKQVVAEGAGADEESELASFDEGVARVDPRAAVKPGERARFAVDTARMQFFDLSTDLAIWD